MVAGQNFVYLFYTETENEIKYSFIEFFNVDLLDPGLFIWNGSSRSRMGCNSDLPFGSDIFQHLFIFWICWHYAGFNNNGSLFCASLISLAIRKNSKYVVTDRIYLGII